MFQFIEMPQMAVRIGDEAFIAELFGNCSGLRSDEADSFTYRSFAGELSDCQIMIDERQVDEPVCFVG